MYKIKEGDSKFIDVKEARNILGLGKTSTKVYTIIKNNNIEYLKFGKRIEILRESLYNYINKELKKKST